MPNTLFTRPIRVALSYDLGIKYSIFRIGLILGKKSREERRRRILL